MDNIQYIFKHSDEELASFMKSDKYQEDPESLLDPKEKLIVADLKLR